MRNYREGDTSAMTFWRAMCDSADDRLMDALAEWTARPDWEPHEDSPQHDRFIARCGALVRLTSYCRRRYFDAFYRSKEERR